MKGKKMNENNELNCKETENKKYTMLEFAPEPCDMLDVKSRYPRFTVGKKYPVLQKNPYSFRTVDDEENHVLMDEKYFISTEDPKLCGDFIEEKTFDVREAHRKSNFQSSDNNLNDLLEDSKVYKRLLEKPPILLEGVVKDSGNELLNNIEMCSLSVSNIFVDQRLNRITNYNEIINEIIETVKTDFPQLKIKFSNFENLDVNNARTKITKTQIKNLYIGLREFTSEKSAKNIASKLISKQLKKIF
jgi:hypothetical protein